MIRNIEYEGWRVPDSFSGTTNTVSDVVVERIDGKTRTALRHIVVHSPTGFNWSYQGSGPSDLALSLLVDALGETLQGTQQDRSVVHYARTRWQEESRAWHLHHDFKRAYVAHWGDRWRITQTEILSWVEQVDVKPTPRIVIID
jgi:hypothetical protein